MGEVIRGVGWVATTVIRFYVDAAEPEVTAGWFVRGDGGLGPYALSAQIGAVLLVGFVFASVIQGVLTGDVAGMLRRTAVHVPAAVFGTIALAQVTHVLVEAVDELSDWVLGVFDADLVDLAAAMRGLVQQVPSSAGGVIVLIVGALTLIGGLVVIAELAVRSAL